jgi:hypothetical protein
MRSSFRRRRIERVVVCLFYGNGRRRLRRTSGQEKKQPQRENRQNARHSKPNIGKSRNAPAWKRPCSTMEREKIGKV